MKFLQGLASLFVTPKATERALSQLRDAELELVDKELQMEHFNFEVQRLRATIARLRKQTEAQ